VCSDGLVFVGELIVRYRDRPWWDRLVAVAFLLLGGLYATDYYEVFAGWPHSPVWAHLVLLVCACTAQAFRRRAPLRSLGAGVVFFLADVAIGVSIPIMIVLIDLLFSATTHTTGRASRWIVKIVIGTVLLGGLAVGVLAHDWRVTFFIVLNGFSVLIVPVWWAFNVRQQWEIAEAERANSRQLSRIAELDRHAAVAAERGRMARDLHDVVAGHLSAIAIQSEALLSMVDENPQVVRTVLKSVRENSIQSLEEMRAMIEVLRDSDDYPRTAPTRLAELDRLIDSARAGGLTVHGDYIVDSIPVAVDLAAYRIVQEALTNALKHAAGGTAQVCVRVVDDQLVVEVTNNLVGAPGSGTGTGLVNMRERAHAVGGTFSAGPWSGGWRVRAELPKGGPQ
jgi:signal transduction histidine kinase